MCVILYAMLWIRCQSCVGAAVRPGIDMPHAWCMPCAMACAAPCMPAALHWGELYPAQRISVNTSVMYSGPYSMLYALDVCTLYMKWTDNIYNTATCVQFCHTRCYAMPYSVTSARHVMLCRAVWRYYAIADYTASFINSSLLWLPLHEYIIIIIVAVVVVVVVVVSLLYRYWLWLSLLLLLSLLVVVFVVLLIVVEELSQHCVDCTAARRHREQHCNTEVVQLRLIHIFYTTSYNNYDTI